MIKCMMFTDESMGIIEEDIDHFLEIHNDIKIINAHTVVMGGKYSTIIFYEDKK